ncbi:MAG: hypothetical protein ACJ79S_19315 [Gemmatimonadaceae bacterium]
MTARGGRRPARRALAARRLATPALVAPLLPLYLAAMACAGERERLDVPRLALELASPAPAPGGSVDGSVDATDGSGITSLAVYACTADSVFSRRETYDRARAARLEFSLHVASSAPVGAPVEVYATATDDQELVAEASRVVHVGGAAGTGTADGAGLCAAPRSAARGRHAGALPTAP